MQTRILVIRFGSMGDVILTSPTVLNLKLAYPDGHLVFLTKNRWAELAARLNGVDEVIPLPEKQSAAALFRFMVDLDRRDFNLVVDLHGNFRSWFSRTMVTASHTGVYPKRRLERWKITRRRKTWPLSYPHTVDLYNQTLESQGKLTPCRRPLLSPPALSAENRELFADSGETVVIAPGAAHPTKAWPVERFAQVGAVLHRERNCRIIWAVASDDRERQTAALTILPNDTKLLVGCQLDQLAAVIARSDLVVANDSGVGHIASAVGTPTLSLFGPTHPVLGFAPRGLRDVVIQVDEPCRPCSRHGKKECFREERYCFTRISSEQVTTRAIEMLIEQSRLKPALFVDRDGTIIVNKHYLSDPDQVEFIPGAAGGLRRARELGYKLILISNQSGVARGYHSLESVERVNQRLVELLRAESVTLDDIYFCPHHPTAAKVSEFATTCDCRKPAPGMVEAAALRHGVDVRRSVVIGDSRSDIDLGRVVGAKSVLVKTGYGAELAREHGRRLDLVGVEFADDLKQAVDKLAAGS